MNTQSIPFNTKKADQVHENKYDYSLVKYKNIDTKVKIICPIHGVFEQTPYKHINRRQGCGKCKGEKISKTKRMDFDVFLEKCNSVHDNKYNYSKFVYKNAHVKSVITCPSHGDFMQNPNNHIYNKNGCPSCGYNVSKMCSDWLDDLGIENKNREIFIKIKNKNYKVDAFVLEDNTIYEYFGYFWHGHPDYFDPKEKNPRSKILFGELYKKTLDRIECFEKSEYKLVYKWGK